MARYDTSYQFRLHNAFRKTRDRTIAALYASGEDWPAEDWDDQDRYAEKTAVKLCGCGRYAAMYRDPTTGELAQSQARCKHRLCPRCNAIRSQQLTKAIEGHLEKLNSPRMLTLTPQHTNQSLRDQIEHLYESYKRLRRSKAYQLKIKGGVAVFEVTYNSARAEWHPHLHVLVDGDYWKQSDIKEACRIASNGSEIVHIKMIHDRSKAGHYVAKYVGKIGDVNGIPTHKIPELAEALHGLRMVQTSGSLYGSTNNKKQEKRSEPLEFVAPLGPVANAANSGEIRPRRILKALQLASKCKCPDGTDGLPTVDEFRCRQAAKFLRNWWDEQTKGNSDGIKKRCKDKARKPDAGDRALRLWEEPEPTADALASGL